MPVHFLPPFFFHFIQMSFTPSLSSNSFSLDIRTSLNHDRFFTHINPKSTNETNHKPFFSKILSIMCYLLVPVMALLFVTF